MSTPLEVLGRKNSLNFFCAGYRGLITINHHQYKIGSSAVRLLTGSTPKLFDAHTHTQFAAFSEDQEAVIERALRAGVWIINVGTQKDTSAKAVETADKFPEGVYATVGIHPIHTEKSYHDPQELGGAKGFDSRGEEFDHEYYKKLASHPKVVAIGECGLDYYRLTSETKGKQLKTFLQQVELAREVKKSLMVHCRQAYSDLVGILVSEFKSLNSPPGVIHFFSGDMDHAQKLLDLGFYFTFGGVITFARDYDEVVKYVPLDRIMLETDAPYVAPVPYRGKRNEPAFVVEAANRLAELKKITPEEAYFMTTATARSVFRI